MTTSNKYVRSRVEASVETLSEKLDRNEIIYGVNTGFGGSADTHTNNHVSLQKALLQTLNSAILLPQDRGMMRSDSGTQMDFSEIRSHSMPTSWVRAAMIIRCNSLLRGHSGVRFVLIDHIIELLKNGMIPVIPLRGSISASGDLTPLSYIAGALEGNPDISVMNEKTGEVIAADKALDKLGLLPIQLGPKEGLGLLNGTAFSAGAGALVVFDVSQLLLLSHILTTMGSEALGAGRENYHPFISNVRPHDGQRETAHCLFNFLGDSKLSTAISEQNDQFQGTHTHKLAQTRYALRTSPQWIGPQVENLTLALQQVQCELNSTTDNPLIDSNNSKVYHGGNFQAVSITTAMEKAQNAMQMLGKMIFAQCSEIINPDTSNGLPPNLSIDDPSLSFTCKGLDINMAAYMSELAYLNHPVSNHIQSAEMHNQSLNSLAFISCRYANDAVEILSMMAATYLYVLCQALDLRAFHLEFVRNARGSIGSITREVVFPTGNSSLKNSDQRILKIQETLWNELMHHWGSHRMCDLRQRCHLSVKYSVGALLEHCSLGENAIGEWKKAVSNALEKSYQNTRVLFIREPSTKKYLCHASRTFYAHVREHLCVPLNEGIIDHPTYDTDIRERSSQSKRTIGSQVSKIYGALRHGEFRELLESCWQENNPDQII
ncbi:hypothetical protein VI817_010152 [Penicillium citrinum]|nr:hypothetical protein VI817_010152 [Penicillium citrinum]